MNANLFVALIGWGGSTLVPITALLVSHRRFGGRFAGVDSRFEGLERRLDLLHADMKDLNGRMSSVRSDVALVRGKIGR